MTCVVAFTGHREVEQAHVSLIKSAVYALADSVNEFVVGGALGADSIALDAICDMAEEGKQFPNPIIIVPDKVASQPRQAVAIIGRAMLCANPVIIELKQGHSAWALKHRNMEMIERVIGSPDGYVLAYWREIYKSGTNSARLYAKKLGISVRDIELPR